MLSAPPSTPGWIATNVVVDAWPERTQIFRAHPHVFGSTQFDHRPEGSARFSPLWIGRSLVPVLHGGENDRAVASETIFHTVDVAGSSVRPRNVSLAKYSTWHWSCVVSTRPLRLIRLDGDGLDALQVSRAELIEGGRSTYPMTQRWAAALVGAVDDADGLWWKSRQDPDLWAVMLLGKTRRRAGGIRESDLAGTGPVIPFATPSGLGRLDAIGLDFDVTVLR